MTTFDSLAWTDRDAAAGGTCSRWLPMIHYWYCRAKIYVEKPTDYITPPTPDRLLESGLDTSHAGLICLDAEPYMKLPYNRARFKRYYEHLIAAAREAWPNAAISIFGPPCNRVLNKQMLAHEQELHHFDFVYPLVDFINPQCYNAGSSWNQWQAAMQHNRMLKSLEAAAIGGNKPVMPIIDTRLNTKPLDYTRGETEIFLGLGAAGVALWDAKSRYTTPADELSQTWREYLNAMCAVADEAGIDVPDHGAVNE